MTHAQNILDYLWSVAPECATNSQTAASLNIKSHQTVYMVTQDLLKQGLVHGEQQGQQWVFHAVEELDGGVEPHPEPASTAAGSTGPMTAWKFETLACKVMSGHYGARLSPGSVPGVRKKFDLVSKDRKIVGDAKYYTLVGGVKLPPAKFSVIAEHVWLLEKTGAPSSFLVFGNDRQVPVLWLKRYGNLVSGVDFYFLSDEGRLERLWNQG